jgi:Trehalose utilisation
MKILLQWACAAVGVAALLVPVGAQEKERDIFNYVGQKNAPKEVKKIVFIADVGTHGGKGNHEFKAGAVYMARVLNSTYPNAHAVVYPNTRWPKDLAHADAVIVLLNHGGKAATDPAIKTAVEKNDAGFMAIHYGVEVTKGVQGDAFLKYMGGYFEQSWSVNPHWNAKIDSIGDHETTRGVKPFTINDEWYYHMRFVEGMKGVTPVLSAVPDLKTLSRWDGKKPHPYNGNDAVMEAVKAGKPQHLAWAYVRPDGGRGFGFTGYHNYNNLTNDSFRTLLLNAAAWTAKLEVPSGGIATKTPTKDDLEKLWQDGERIPQP